jgi:hypothetical protein
MTGKRDVNTMRRGGIMKSTPYNDTSMLEAPYNDTSMLKYVFAMIHKYLCS